MMEKEKKFFKEEKLKKKNFFAARWNPYKLKVRCSYQTMNTFFDIAFCALHRTYFKSFANVYGRVRSPSIDRSIDRFNVTKWKSKRSREKNKISLQSLFFFLLKAKVKRTLILKHLFFFILFFFLFFFELSRWNGEDWKKNIARILIP